MMQALRPLLALIGFITGFSFLLASFLEIPSKAMLVESAADQYTLGVVILVIAYLVKGTRPMFPPQSESRRRDEEKE